MKAMILAAGVGSRLAPLTDETPKALVPFQEKPILENLLRKLQTAGFSDITINVHHLGEQIEEYINAKVPTGLKINVSVESELLDTGGGIKKARHLLGTEPVLFYNVDILSDIDLEQFYHFHQESGNQISLAVSERHTSRSLLFTSEGQLSGWHYPERHLTIITRNSRGGYKEKAFSGIYIINPELFDDFPDEPVFSIMPWIIEMSKTQVIKAYDHSGDLWFDLGRLQNLKKAEKKVRMMKNGNPTLS